MADLTHLADLLREGAPVVRMFRTALERDATAAELEDGRRWARETGSLLPLAASLMAGAEFRPAPGRPGDPEELLSRATSPRATDEIALLPGLLPGMPPDEQTAYELWMKLYDQPTQADLDAIPRRPGPAIAIAMAVGDTEAEAALRSIAALERQVHSHWTLHLATRLLSPWPREALVAGITGGRVFLQACDGDDPLDAALEAAIRHADLGLLAILEPGDTLAPTALDEVAAVFLSAPTAVMLSTDEDVLDSDGRRRLPRFKPAYSPHSSEAPGQLAVYRASLLRTALSAPDRSFANPVAAIASAAARIAGDRLLHIPAILCHRPSSRRGRALSLPASPLPCASPATTIIVPTRNQAGFLTACADGVLHRTPHAALELLIVDNGSDHPDALQALDRLAGDTRVRVVRAPGPFNFARLNNAAVAASSGDILVLLNDDIEIRSGDWLEELERLALQPDVGAVGGRLLYPNGTIQHAGILLGPGGAATHVGRHFPAGEPGYLGRFERVCELSAVTGACLAVRREVWHRVGGMDERLAVTFNDVDFCLRVRAAGLRVLWTPHATLVHHEAQSRGLESEDPARLERFAREQAILLKTWGDAVRADPFLNANLLAVSSGHLVATRPRRPRPWQQPRLPGNAEAAIHPDHLSHPADLVDSADGDSLGSARPDI